MVRRGRRFEWVPPPPLNQDLSGTGGRTSRQVLSSAARAIVVLVLAAAAAGCLGDGGGGNGSGESRRSSVADGFEELERRPLELPDVDLHGRSIQEHGVAGRCVEDGGIPVNAVVLPHIPGVAALGPVGPPERDGPVYAALPEGAPRIVFLSLVPTLRDSRWRVVRTLWISRPTYDGPVLVRAGRLDRPGTLGLGDELPPRASLRLPAGAWPGAGVGAREGGSARQAGWRVTTVPTLIREPGCYAFQVDGLGFSYVLAFGAQFR